ncbi:hypothetical protein RAS_02440 [Rickettsia asiatica]|uniref:Uncharacterized protein n=1 Tax=Rickettsia asiatica TaxID=238800 RepID=A0A510G8Z1_9RICK|nr:hypothetical protein [Rickettsia asiatica]BBJ31135.1 hypothetical protein RAS_02440 [Rickettsia asiatica]
MSHCLRGSKNAFGVIPWLDHGIQKTIKNTKIISILHWIPLQARGGGGMTWVEIDPRKPNLRRNDIECIP